MTTYCLEMRSTQNWNDVRFRDYTRSATKANQFERVPRIDFADSGHGIVPHVSEGRHGPRISVLAEHVEAALKQEPKNPKGPSKDERPASLARQVEELRKVMEDTEHELSHLPVDGKWASVTNPVLANIRAALSSTKPETEKQ